MSDANIVYLKKDDFLMREGEDSSEMYYLNDGLLAVLKLKGGSEQQISTLRPGELVGEMSFLDNEPRSASVRALDDCELTKIPKKKLDKYIEEQPKWMKSLLVTLTDRLRKANQRVRV